MSDILSRLEAQGQGFSNIAERGQEMVQGFDNDRLMAQGQTLAYNMGKAQLSTLIGAERVAGLQHGVPVVYKAGKAIADRLSGMPTTREEAVAQATKAAQAAARKAAAGVAQKAAGAAQRVESTAKPFVADLAETGLSDRAKAIPPEALEAMSKSKGVLSDTSELDLQPSQVNTLDAPRLTEPAPVSRYNIDTRAPELKYNLPSPRRPLDLSEQIGEPTAEGDAEASSTGLKPVGELFQSPPSVDTGGSALPQGLGGSPTSAMDPALNLLKTQDDEEQDLQERLESLKNVTGDTGGSQPSLQPKLNPEEGVDKPPPVKPPPVSEGAAAGTEGAELGAEEGLAAAIPGFGEIIGGIIGIGALVASAVESHGPSKPPQQAPGMPAMQTAYDSAPVIDSDNYHAL